MKIYNDITVDLYDLYPLKKVEAQQNNVGRGARITLTAGGLVLSLDGESVTMWAKKPDGMVSYLACSVVDGKIQADFTSQMLAVPGDVQVELQLIHEEESITTPIFTVHVRKSNITDSAVESTNEFTALVKALKEVDEIKKTIQKGEKGEDGEAATVTVGTVEQTPVGTAPTVTNSGTDSAAVLDFTFPAPETGFYDVTMTLAVDVWESTGELYSQTVSAAGMETDKAATYAQVIAGEIPTDEEQAQYALLKGVVQSAGQVTFYCTEQPTMELTVRAYCGAGTEGSGGGGALNLSIVAADFSTDSEYEAGTYCVYNQQLNRFSEKKEAGAWDGSKVVKTTVADELTAIAQRVEKIEKSMAAAGPVRFESESTSSGTTQYTRVLHIDRSQVAGESQKAYFINCLNDFCVLKFSLREDGLYSGVGAQGVSLNNANVYIATKTVDDVKSTDVYVTSSYTIGKKMSIKELLSDVADEMATDPFTIIEYGEKHTYEELSTEYDAVIRPTNSRLDQYCLKKKTYKDLVVVGTGDSYSSELFDDGGTLGITRSIRSYDNLANKAVYITTSGKQRCISFSAILISKTSGMSYPLPYSNMVMTSSGTEEQGRIVFQITGSVPTTGILRSIGTTGIDLSDCILVVDRQYITLSS